MRIHERNELRDRVMKWADDNLSRRTGCYSDNYHDAYGCGCSSSYSYYRMEVEDLDELIELVLGKARG